MKLTLRQKLILWLLEQEQDGHKDSAQQEQLKGYHREAAYHTTKAFEVGNIYAMAVECFAGSR